MHSRIHAPIHAHRSPVVHTTMTPAKFQRVCLGMADSYTTTVDILTRHGLNKQTHRDNRLDTTLNGNHAKTRNASRNVLATELLLLHIHVLHLRVHVLVLGRGNIVELLQQLVLVARLCRLCTRRKVRAACRAVPSGEGWAERGKEREVRAAGSEGGRLVCARHGTRESKRTCTTRYITSDLFWAGKSRMGTSAARQAHDAEHTLQLPLHEYGDLGKHVISKGGHSRIVCIAHDHVGP